MFICIYIYPPPRTPPPPPPHHHTFVKTYKYLKQKPVNVISPLLLFFKECFKHCCGGGGENKTLQNPHWAGALLLCINGEGLCCSFKMSLVSCSSSIWRLGLIRGLLGSIPHPAHLFPQPEAVLEAPLCPLEMALCPQPGEMTKAALMPSRGQLLGGKKQPADTLRKLLLYPPALTNVLSGTSSS